MSSKSDLKRSSPPRSAAGGMRFSWWVGIGVLVLAAVVAVQHARKSTSGPAVAADASESAAPSPAAQPVTTGPRVPRESLNSSTADLAAQVLNPALDLRARRRAARALAQQSSDEAIAALRTALQDGPPAIKAAIAECLGESTHPQARVMLLELIDGADETVACGAIRGFAVRGDAEAADVLSNLLFNAKKTEIIRTEAALALGEVAQPSALTALTRAATEIRDDSITEQVMEGLAKRPFAETQEFFKSYIETPGLPTASRVTAVEALSNAEGDVAPFLFKYATDPSPDVRAAAAWALSSAEPLAELTPKLLELTQHETSAEVRSRLYQALGNQETYDASAILALSRGETDPTARLASFDLVATACRAKSTPDLANYFDQTALPELKSTALNGESLPERLASVITLGRAPTPQAVAALQEIAQQASDRQVVAAAQAALRVQPRKP